MKFYFCQGCGKRITENQIASGQARDKKLRGVYCTACAGAVSTLDTLPLSNEEAKQLLKDKSTESEPAPQGAGPSVGELKRKRAGRRTSGVRLPKVDREAGAQSGRTPAQSGPGIVPFVLMGALIALGLGVFLVVAGGDGPDRKVAAKKKSNVRVRDVSADMKMPNRQPSTEKKPESGPVSNPDSKVAPKPVGDLTAPDQKSAEKKVSAPPQKQDNPEQAADPDEKEPPTPEVAQPANVPEEKPDPKADKKAEKPAKPERDMQAVASAEKHLQALREHLKQPMNLKAAEDAAIVMAEDPALGKEAAAGTATVAVVKVLTARRAACIEALKKLVGNRVALEQVGARRSKPVEIAEVGNENVTVKSTFTINDQVKTRTSKVPLDRISEKSWERVLPSTEPRTPDAWMARALLGWARGDAGALAPALNGAPEHPLAFYVKRELERIEMGRREFEARETWARIEKKVEAKKWKECMADAETFVEKHWETRFRKEGDKRIAARLMALEQQFSTPVYELPHIETKDPYNKPPKPGKIKLGVNMARSGIRHLAMNRTTWTSYRLDKKFRVFKSWVTLSPSGVAAMYCNFHFVVFGDGRKLWESPPMKLRKDLAFCAVDVTDVEVLKLAFDADGNSHYGIGGWVEPRVISAKVPLKPTLAVELPPTPHPSRVTIEALKPGVRGTYYKDAAFKEAGLKRIDNKLRHFWADGSPGKDIPKNHFSARWTGYIQITESGEYIFELMADNKGRFKLGGAWLFGSSKSFITERKGARDIVRLKEGVYELQLDLVELGGTTEIKLLWMRRGRGSTTLEDIPADVLFHKPDAGD